MHRKFAIHQYNLKILSLKITFSLCCLNFITSRKNLREIIREEIQISLPFLVWLMLTAPLERNLPSSPALKGSFVWPQLECCFYLFILNQWLQCTVLLTSLKNLSTRCTSAELKQWQWRQCPTPPPPLLFQADLSQVWPEANQHFSKEIDDEANSYFQRIYNHPPHPTMSVDEVSCAEKFALTSSNYVERIA